MKFKVSAGNGGLLLSKFGQIEFGDTLNTWELIHFLRILLLGAANQSTRWRTRMCFATSFWACIRERNSSFGIEIISGKYMNLHATTTTTTTLFQYPHVSKWLPYYPLVFTKSVNRNFLAFWLASVARNILGYSLFCNRSQDGVSFRAFSDENELWLLLVGRTLFLCTRQNPRNVCKL